MIIYGSAVTQDEHSELYIMSTDYFVSCLHTVISLFLQSLIVYIYIYIRYIFFLLEDCTILYSFKVTQSYSYS